MANVKAKTRVTEASKAAAEVLKAEKPVEKKEEAPKAEKKAAPKTEKKAAAPKKAAVKKAETETSVTIQFGGREFAAKEILAKAQAAVAAAHKDVEIKSFHLYVKPAYYVVNGEGSDDYKIGL